MPKKSNSRVPFDVGAWLSRCNLNKLKAAELLGVSTTQLWRLENVDRIPLIYMWAMRGIEHYIFKDVMTKGLGE